jgi:LuxR family maltose regulon positive regulatory protein
LKGGADVPVSFMQSKLDVPQISNRIIQRHKLDEILEKYKEYKLVLVSSPAGSGKSTVIADYIMHHNVDCAWFSLDKSDDDVFQFATYLIEGLKKNKELCGVRFQELLESIQSIGVMTFIRAIINEIHNTSGEYTFVFDDYHLIQLPEIHHMMAQLVEFSPANMHVIIITREDPPLPLGRWRVRNQLMEIRIGDLKFTDSEADNFLNHSMMLQLSKDDVYKLNNRAEGWIAGLQLVALFMRNHPDKAQFVADFSGNHYYIMDYLLEEVLQQQPPQVKEFLLCSSIFNRFCYSLCDEVMELEKGTSQEMVELLLRANTFIIPLDYQHFWFRYHHLFKDLLLQKLSESKYPIKKYHRLASHWFYENDNVMEAIYHAICAEDTEFAADLVESIWAEMDQTVQGNQWLKLVKKLPDDIIRQRPVLNVGYAWALIDSGDLENCIERLEETNKQIENSRMSLESKDYVIFDYEQFKMLPANIASAYAYIAAAKGNTDDVLFYANKALSLISDDNKLRKGVVQMLLSFSYWGKGELENALETINAGLSNVLKADSPLSLSNLQLMLVEIRIEMGDFSEAEKIAHQTIELLQTEDKVPLALASLYLKLSEINLLRGNVISATDFLNISREKGMHLHLPDFEHKWYIMQAEILSYKQLYVEAISSLEEAKKCYFMNPIPEHISIDGFMTSLYLKMHRFDMCQDISLKDIFPTEQDRLVYVKYLLTDYFHSKNENTLIHVFDILDEMLACAQKQNRKRSMIDIMLCKAIALNLNQDNNTMVDIAKEAMALATTERYVFPFIDNIEELSGLYRSLIIQKALPDFLELHILNRLNENKPNPVGGAKSKQVDLLSPRELEVLKLMAQGHSNQEIGDILFLALSTVKGYNRSIFDKLAVKRRTEAIAKAREIRIIE